MLQELVSIDLVAYMRDYCNEFAGPVVVRRIV